MVIPTATIANITSLISLILCSPSSIFFFFQAEDGIRDLYVTGVQTCALPISTLVSAGVGWFRRRFWGWALAVTIVTIQVVGSLMNAILGSAFKGVIGLILAGILLYFLLRLQVRGFFANAARPKVPR